MIKTILKIVFAASGTILILYFFQPKENNIDDGKIHIRYWYATGQKEEQPFIVQYFNSVQDSIVVEAIAIPWQESEKKILTAILSDNPPDIIDHFAPIVKWASRMGLHPLDEFIEADQFDHSVVFPANWEEMKWQGHVFGMPTATAAYALFYNRRLFRESGLDPEKPPQTWAEVEDYSKKLMRINDNNQLSQLGFIFYLGRTLKVSQQSEEPLLLMAWQRGIPFIDPAGERLLFANEQMVDLVNYVKGIQTEISLNELLGFTAGFGYGDQHGFTSERVAMMILPSNFQESIERYNPILEFGVAEVPHFVGTTTSSSTATWWMAIPRGSKHPKAAWEFMKFAVEKDIQLKSLKSMDENLFPANRRAALDSSFLNQGFNRIFLKQLEFAHSTTIVPLAHDAFWREFTNATERCFHNQEQPMVSLEQARQVVQNELDRAISYDKYVRAHMEFGELNQ